MDLYIARVAVSLNYHAGDFLPGPWYVALPVGVIGNLRSAGLYRRLGSASGISIFDGNIRGTPLSPAPTSAEHDAPDLCIDLGMPIRNAEMRFGFFDDDAAGIGAFAALFSKEAIAVQMLLFRSHGRIPSIDERLMYTGHRNRVGPLTHVALSSIWKTQNAIIAAEAFLSTGTRIKPRPAISVGVETSALGIIARSEMSVWTRGFVLPGGEVMAKYFVCRTGVKVHFGNLALRIYHRLDIDHLLPIPGMYRESQEKFGCSGSGKVGSSQRGVFEYTLSLSASKNVDGYLSRDPGYEGSISGRYTIASLFIDTRIYFASVSDSVDMEREDDAESSLPVSADTLFADIWAFEIPATSPVRKLRGTIGGSLNLGGLSLTWSCEMALSRTDSLTILPRISIVSGTQVFHFSARFEGRYDRVVLTGLSCSLRGRSDDS